MENKPRVSVITPTFNRADYLPVAIDSVLAQTFGDFELIVIDDGSTDGTPELMKGYSNDSRVRYVQQPNQGQSVARNRGVAESVGDFICFLDSDNAWVETKLAASLRAFDENPQADVVYGDYVVIDAEGRELGINRMTRYSGRITPMLICDNFVSMNTTMTRRHCFDEMGAFDSNDRLAEDYGLWLRFSTRYQFLYLPEVLGYYRVMEDQISSDKDSRFKANEELILEFLKAYPDALDSLEVRQGLSRFYHRKGRYELSVGRSRSAGRDLGRSLLQYPVWSGPWRLAAKLAVHLLRGGAS
ncbi:MULTISPECIES: glycosyltransferase [Marinobacter]|uniref:Spore coat polysaccharide biosynthesis protein SpsA n=1 Tax=Marinobacter litoralis TaxID=187981 RepID=A0A3M2RLV0_9GAMM|nr:glycosyltransferase [Marinobacter litoralis]RMJ06142.1 Spore coat polysaccharide biosynthesis protein SpsA [Marinobacter litoralis]